MPQAHIQASYNSGEWSPNLYARVDVAKYHTGAALLRNFFVDYRGGASTRTGTVYDLMCYISDRPVRLIAFQASLSVQYILEFGDEYIRFHKNGAPVLETGLNITGASKANPCNLTIVGHGLSVGDWVYVSGVGGMTQLNGKYYEVGTVPGVDNITLKDLFGNNVNSLAYTTYTAGGTAARVYTLVSPYDADDLATLRFTQNVNTLILTHLDYVPYSLRFSTPTSWLLAPVSFGTDITAPTGGAAAISPVVAGLYNYGYVVTAVDVNGQESVPSALINLNNVFDIRSTPGTVTITWNAVAGAASYNVYRADIRQGNVVPAGVPMGFIGNATGTLLYDSNIAPDFSESPPVARNPFAPGASVQSVTITVAGSYTVAPTVSFSAPPAGITASGGVVLEVITCAPNSGGAGYAVGDRITIGSNTVIEVATEAAGTILTVTIVSPGVYTGALPSNPLPQISTDGGGTAADFDVTWGVLTVTITNGGTGYLVAPTATFSAGAAAGTAVLGPATAGNPSVPTFFQQRLCLAATLDLPQVVYGSQTGHYFNFDVHSPVIASDAWTANIVSGQLNNIKALIPQPGGLIVLTDGASFLINGGSLGSAVTPQSLTANPQSFLGCNDMPPIVVNFDILYVQSRGSSVRDASYNFYANVFTGTDISVISSHLFFGYELREWAWAEEPYKIVWAVRNDGQLLSLTFLKEQEFTGWAHSDTTGGSFKSVASIVEPATVGYQNYTYFVVERTVQAQTVKYIEYFPERIYANGVEDAICVDCAYVYSGAPTASFTGATALAGLTVTGLADGEVIPSFVMPADGSFTLAAAASKVSVGLGFTAQLKTLYLDTGNPTIQSLMKKIPKTTVRVTETLGLAIGTDFDYLVAMKDLIRGNVGSMTNELVTDLVTGDAQTYLDAKWQTQGVFCIEQSQPLPATILGVVPDLTVENKDSRGE